MSGRMYHLVIDRKIDNTVSYVKSIKKTNKILNIRFKSALTSEEDTPLPEF